MLTNFSFPFLNEYWKMRPNQYIYIHSQLKFKSKRLVHFLDGYETWDTIVLFVFVDRIKVKTQSKEGSRTFNLPMKSTESLNGGKGKWDHSPTS